MNGWPYSLCSSPLWLRLEKRKTPEIHGAVTDPSGLPVAGADTKATLVSRGLERTAKSGPTGDFLFPLMPVGTYTVEVRQPDSRDFREPA